MATVDAETGRSLVAKLEALLPGAESKGGLAYVALMGLALPAAVLVEVSALTAAGPSGAGLLAGIAMFLATWLAFEAGWYVATGAGE